jgi:hypothetical protein
MVLKRIMSVRWINLAQDKGNWWALVTMAMDLLVP